MRQPSLFLMSKNELQPFISGIKQGWSIGSYIGETLTVSEIEISNWSQNIQNIQCSTQAFYKSVERNVIICNIPGIRISRKLYKEGGFFSSRREYLCVSRGPYVFKISSGLFGTGFFVSWWFNREISFWQRLLYCFPFIGPVLKNNMKSKTWYQEDTHKMFQGMIHTCVLNAIESITSTQGFKGFSEGAAKPIMKEFYRP